MTPNPFRYAFALLAACACLGAEPAVNLWPAAAPGEKGDIGPEKDMTKTTDPFVAGRILIHLGNVSVPTMTFYPAPAARNTGTTVVVCPGGGYYILALDLEGSEVCEWLNSIGVNAVLLKYRVPRRAGRPEYEAPLQDVQRAFVTVRSHAKEWGISPDRIGVLGFSAGGNLCAVASASRALSYPRVDAMDDLSFHPNFQILIYPAYLLKDNFEHGSLEVAPPAEVDAQTPPTFMVMAEDDPVHVENILGYALALKKQGTPMELHVYPTGGHGYGLRPTKDFVTTWPARATDWLQSLGFLAGK
jgi:acetyl esterase/lipase